MAAQHITAAAIVVDLAREKAIRAAMEKLVAAADDLARAAGVGHLFVSLGQCDPVHDAASRAGWRMHVTPYSHNPTVGFGVASTHGAVARVDVYGPDVPLDQPALTPATDANPIVLRPLGLGV